MNKRALIPIGLLILLVLLGTILYIHSNKAPNNDISVIGNTAGNLNNNGLFCEYNGTVYFANPNDNGALYSMNPDESNAKKISNVAPCSINVDNNRIYYTMSGDSAGSGLGYIRKATGLYSIRHNGSDSLCYTMDAVGIASLCGNYLYFQHYAKPDGTNLDKIRIDKKDNKRVADNMVSPASIDSGIIYFNGDSDNHYLYSFDTATDTATSIYNHNMYNPIYLNGDVYYMDLESNYQLRKYSIYSGEDTKLTDEAVDMFNVYQDMIVYQTASASSNPALMRMNTNGDNKEIIAEGIFCDINITSQYIYYHEYASKYPTYHQSLYGYPNPSVFTP